MKCPLVVVVKTTFLQYQIVFLIIKCLLVVVAKIIFLQYQVVHVNVIMMHQYKRMKLHVFRLHECCSSGRMLRLARVVFRAD